MRGTISNCIHTTKAMGVILVIDVSSSQALKEKLRQSSVGNKGSKNMLQRPGKSLASDVNEMLEMLSSFSGVLLTYEQLPRRDFP